PNSEFRNIQYRSQAGAPRTFYIERAGQQAAWFWGKAITPGHDKTAGCAARESRGTTRLQQRHSLHDLRRQRRHTFTEIRDCRLDLHHPAKAEGGGGTDRTSGVHEEDASHNGDVAA